jgi:AraC-like DNA-binding protein
MANKFPFGAWVYHSINEIAVDEVDLWANMGLTVTMAPGVSMHNEAELEKLSQFLDKAASRDVKLILNVSGIGRSGDYEKDFTEVYNRFKGHPALYGFVIGDEPTTKKAVDGLINIMRIQMAKDMLTNTDSPISKIANDVGFDDQNYFSRLFKKYTKLSPSQYRNN